MSFGKNLENSYFYLFEEEQKKELNNLWEYFMTSFNYNTYYHLTIINNKKSDSNYFLTNNNNNSHSENYLKSNAIKKLNNFFKKYEIIINNDFNLTSNIFTSITLLSEAKLWIMYLILSNFKNDYNINKNLILYNFALKKNCDSISLFEFFLISFSQINPDVYIQQIKNINKNNIPQEFIKIFKNNKKILYDIFNNNNDKENIIDDIYTIPTSTLFNKFNTNTFNNNNININNNNNNNNINDDNNNFNKFEEENSFSFGIKNKNNNNNNKLEELEIESLNFSENEEFIFKDIEDLSNFNINLLNSDQINNNDDDNLNNIDDKYLNPNNNEENEIIENEELNIIIKDYLSKGFFAIAEKKTIKNNENNFIIIPLKEKFNYDEKINVIYLLNKLNKSKFSNFEYYPFQFECVEKIKKGKISYEII